MQRRELLSLLGIGAATIGVNAAIGKPTGGEVARLQATRLPFRPVPAPLPLPSDGLSAAEQRRFYRQVLIEDRLVVPDGYRVDLVAAWGDRLAEGRFGFNNDYLAFEDLGGGRALLTVNFEYISPRSWGQAHAEVIGTPLPLQELADRLQPTAGRVDVLALAAGDPLWTLCRSVAAAAMEDLGVGVCEIRRQADGGWRLQPGSYDRRITGLAGLEDPSRRLQVSGPAAVVFRNPRRLGYDDGLGDRIIGTFANCAGGQTPWGTVLSAEENVQSQVVEPVFADGSSPPPSQRPFLYDGQRLDGLGNPFGLAGNKYGWMVELDPRRPEQPAVKHSWLGRFRHEAVAIKAEKGQPLIVYSGCDRHGGHLYRFVSENRIQDPKDSASSRLFEAGRLEAALFEADGTGRWIPLIPGTAVDPLRPSHFARFNLTQACLVPHGDRTRAGAEALTADEQVDAYRQKFPTLGNLYPGRGETQMGAILIDAHLAANAVGATPAARPEDTEIDPTTGDLLIAFTAGGGDGDGRADPAIFRGPGGQANWPYGWIMRMSDKGTAAGSGFTWRLAVTGGAPWQGGSGFSNPDNLAVDSSGNVWMVTDRSTKSAELDVFGNNSCWLLPRTGPAVGEALLFATGPMECELCGPCFDSTESTLFLAVQHSGEDNGARPAASREAQVHQLVDRDGTPFEQLRWVPLGSNWPSGVPGRSPRPGVVAIRRSVGGPLLGN